jgi:hypothetical protein
MFFIVPEKPEMLVEALNMLACYHVSAEAYTNDPCDINELYLAVYPDHYESEDDDVGIAEMCFQMNWHQGGKCPECQDICGHMVFTKPIKPAF